MNIFRKFRAFPRAATQAENTEVQRILRRGPHDMPADIRHAQDRLRSLGGW